MLKKNVLLSVDIYTLRRNVDRLAQLNNNNFNSLTQYYEIILNHSEYHELDKDMDENTGDVNIKEEMKKEDLFGVKIKEEMEKAGLFGGEIVEEKQPIYQCYASL